MTARDSLTNVGWDQLAPASAGPPSGSGAANNLERWAGGPPSRPDLLLTVPPYKWQRVLPLCLLITAGFLAGSDPVDRVVRAEEPKVPTAQAPPNQDVHYFAVGGVYYVAKDLKQRRDRLIEQMQSLKNQVDESDISGDEALHRLKNLDLDLDSLQKRLDETKMFVTPFKTSTQTDTVTFELGPEKLVVITADDLRVESWAGPGVKCFLEKTVFTAGKEPAEPQLKALEVVHQRGRFPQIVGRTAAEIEADERKFLDSPDGRKLNAAQRVSRNTLVHQISDSYAVYRDFQGKEIDSIQIRGTEYDQNRSISFGTKSDNGGGHPGQHSAKTRQVDGVSAGLPVSRLARLPGGVARPELEDCARDYECRFAGSGL
jgi:hypothetical protein